MNELDQLKQQNKQLKALLKNAVKLLNRYKEVLQRSAQAPARKGRSLKKKAKVGK